MQFTVHPVTPDRFDDFADVVNPNRRSTHCWCVPHRLRQAEVDELADGDRELAMRALCERELPPGVATYADGIPVGWANVRPRADIPVLVHSRKIRPLDDLNVWSIVCLVIRGGHRKQGYTTRPIEGAVEHAAAHGAPAGEAYPVEPRRRMDTTMAFVGTRAMFEKVGFEVIGRTEATASQLPRLVMRRGLSRRPEHASCAA